MPRTTKFERGEVVLVRFPFTDLSSVKQRPALVVASEAFTASGQDVIVAAISGQRVDHPAKFDHIVKNWEAAGLLMPSVVRVGKLVTLHADLVRRRLGALSGSDLETVGDLLREALSL
jgi:mRNA interferase MazF